MPSPVGLCMGSNGILVLLPSSLLSRLTVSQGMASYTAYCGYLHAFPLPLYVHCASTRLAAYRLFAFHSILTFKNDSGSRRDGLINALRISHSTQPILLFLLHSLCMALLSPDVYKGTRFPTSIICNCSAWGGARCQKWKIAKFKIASSFVLKVTCKWVFFPLHFFNELIVWLYAECSKCRGWEATQHIPETNAWHWILSLCKPDCWAHTPCSPSKKTDSSTLCLCNGRMGVQAVDKLAWEGGGVICQRAEWPWASCLWSTQLSLPTSARRELSPHSLPLKTWWLWLHVQHMPAIKRGCQSYKLFSRLIRPTHALFGGGNSEKQAEVNLPVLSSTVTCSLLLWHCQGPGWDFLTSVLC